MARASIDKALRQTILDARRMVQESEKADCNEAETRRRIERIFESLMGYDAFRHLSRERAVRGAGETEHVDFAIQIEEGEDAKPVIMVEIKRVTVDLAPKHLKQVSSYAINAGCEWILLTNSKEWRVYHVSFGQPPVTKLVHSWNLLTDDVSVLAARFNLVSFKSVKKGALDDLWQKTNVLVPRNMIRAILSENSIKLLRRELKKDSGVLVPLEDVVAGIRRLLNEVAVAELESLRLSFPEAKQSRARRRKTKDATGDAAATEERASEAMAGSVLAAAEAVLRTTDKPLHYREITELILGRGLWQTDGKTPEATVNAAIGVDISAKGSASRFVRTAPGIFALRGSPVSQTVEPSQMPSVTQEGEGEQVQDDT